MISLLATHANTVLLGLVCGAGYYVAARAMEVALLRVPSRSRIGAVIGAFVLRLVLAGAGILAILAWTTLDARALCLGALVGYTFVLGGEAARHFRHARTGVMTGTHRREAAHGR